MPVFIPLQENAKEKSPGKGKELTDDNHLMQRQITISLNSGQQH